MLEDRENLLKYSDISEAWRALRAQNDERRVSFYQVFIKKSCCLGFLIVSHF